MATLSSLSNVNYQSSTAANIQNWAGLVQSLLTSGGWVQTSDTGQTAAASLPATTAANQSVGYQVWRMADALQASYPVYMKIEFGSNAAATTAAVYVTIGTGSDGAGNITGVLFARQQVATSTGSPASTTGSFRGSADTNRLWFALIGNSGAAGSSLLSIERTKDALGADSNEGVLVTIGGSAANSAVWTTRFHQFVSFTNNTFPALTVLGAFVPSGTTWADGTAIGVCPVRYHNASPSNPGLNLMVYLNGDTPASSAVSIAAYGTSHTYLPLGTGVFSTAVPANANASLLCRWE